MNCGTEKMIKNSRLYVYKMTDHCAYVAYYVTEMKYIMWVAQRIDVE